MEVGRPSTSYTAGKYKAQRKYMEAHPEIVEKARIQYLERNRENYNEYHKLYQRSKMEWIRYVYNTKYKYEKQLFLNILMD